MINANSLMVIHPYLNQGVWVFDDPAKDLVQEPFVAGMPEIFEAMVGEAQRFTATFSAAAFPGHQDVLVWERSDMGGNWYRHEASGLSGWLCPALFRYFAEAPERIYFQWSVP